MSPRRSRPLRMYGGEIDEPGRSWADVEARLRSPETIWVVAGGERPHPRPVWGVWSGDALHLTVGSPALRAALVPGAQVSAHLDSGTDVVIVEGVVAGPTSEPAIVAAYDEKYDYPYDLERYGPLTTVSPTTVLAWTAAGVAGRDGFRERSAWTFD